MVDERDIEDKLEAHRHEWRVRLLNFHPRTVDEFAAWVALEYGFQLPLIPCCPEHTAPAEVWWSIYSGKITDAVVIGSRESGKTLGYAIMEHICMLHYSDDISHYGAIEEQSKKCYGYFTSFCNRPHFRDLIEGETLLSKTRFKNGAEIQIMPATMAKANGPHTVVVAVDEWELVKRQVIKEMWSIPKRRGDRPPQLWITSSRKFPFGPLEDLLREANQKRVTPMFWCFAGNTLVSTPLGKKRIDEVVSGDEVWAFDGSSFNPRLVLWSGQTGVRETVVINLVRGGNVRCTEDHLFYTERGWVRAGDLRSGDGVWGERTEQNNSLLRLRTDEVAAFENMQQLSNQADESDEFCLGDEAGRATSVAATEGDALERGIASEAAVGVTRDCDGGTGSVSPVYSRFHRTAHEDGDMRAGILALETGIPHSRQSPRRDATRGRVSGSYSPGRRDGSVGAPNPTLLRVASVDRGLVEPVYDITVDGDHNFIANGLVAHNCVFCVIEKCPEERHRGGIGCRGGDGKPPCPLMEDCLFKDMTEDGKEVYRDGPGRAANVDGWMRIDDVIRQKSMMDSETWKSQWLSLKPMSSGLIYPTFNPEIHVFDPLEWGGYMNGAWVPFNPQLEVYSGTDFGFTNAFATSYGQVTAEDDLIVFAEEYGSGVINEAWAERIKERPWFPRLRDAVGDPAAADGIATLRAHGVPIRAGNNEVDRGIARVRYLLKPPTKDRPMLYISSACPNLIRSLSELHTKEPTTDIDPKEEQVKVDDHSSDSLRYLVSLLYADKLRI